VSTLDVPTLSFVFWLKVALLKLYGKADSPDPKSTSPAKELVFLNECAAVNVLVLEGRMLG
jgi:hypothetical protein